MSECGRKPKPTAIKELEGNPGKRPLSDAEPKPQNNYRFFLEEGSRE